MSVQYKVFIYRLADQYGVTVKRVSDGRSVSVCTGIASEDLALKRAHAYAWSYSDGRAPAPIERIRTAADPLTFEEHLSAIGALT